MTTRTSTWCTGSGTTPQVWLRAEPASNRLRALMAVDRFTITVQSTSAYNDGLWHHVILQRAHGSLRLLVDGVQVAAAAAPDGSVTAGKEFGVQGIQVGQRVDGADRFDGSVDEVPRLPPRPDRRRAHRAARVERRREGTARAAAANGIGSLTHPWRRRRRTGR